MSEIRFNRWSHQSGTGGIYQDSSGNIGIGTSTPTSVLDIQGGSIKIGNDLLTSSGVSTFTSGLNVTGGSVGIGTDNPGAYFSDANDIVLQKTDDCGITIASGTSQKGTVAFADGTTGDQAYRGYIQYNHSTDSLQVATTGTERLRIDSNGLIANNARSPSSFGSPNLLISGTDSTLTLMGDGSTNSTSFTGIKFRVAGASTGDYTKAGIFSRREGGYNDLSIIFALDTVADSSSVSISDEKVRITSSGILSINRTDTTGNNKLQVCGTGDDTAFVRLRRLNGAGDDTAYGGINVVDNNDLTIGTAEFKNQDSTTRSQFVLSTYDNGSLNEVIRVKGSGAIGIGTDSPQQSSIPSIHLHTNTSDDARIAITTPTKPNSRIGYFGLSHKFGMDVHNGFEIRDASDSYATRFTIDSSGNVGINRSSPNSKFHIMGGSLQVGDFSTDTYETTLSNNILSFKRNGDSYIDQLGNGLIHFRLGSSNTSVLKLQDSAEAVKVVGETALTGTTGGAKGLTLQTAGGTSCPLYFGSETNSAQKSMYLNGYWIYLRGHQNEGIRFVFSQAGGNAPRSDQYEFKYNSAYRPTGNTTWDGFSDRRAKENIQDVTSALDTIGRLRPVTFDWTNDYADRMNMFNLDKTDPRSYMWTSVKENGYDETRKNNNVGFTTWEGGMRVPAIFWGAGIVSKSVNEMGSTLDLYPTFMSISNISNKDDNELDGVDLSDLLFSDGSSSREVMPFYNGSELYAFRYKNYKLHLKTSSWFSKVETHDPPMLFDLEIDPSEKYDISEENPEKINEILKIINIHKEKIVFGNDQLESRD